MKSIPIKLQTSGGLIPNSLHKRKISFIREVGIGMAATVTFVVISLLLVRRIKKRKGTLKTFTNCRSEAVIRPFTTDATIVSSGTRASNSAPDMLLETAPRSPNMLHCLPRM